MTATDLDHDGVLDLGSTAVTGGLFLGYDRQIAPQFVLGVEGDVSFLFDGGGRHELKTGYAHQSIYNDLLKNYTNRVYLQYGVPINQNFNFSTLAVPSAPVCDPDGPYVDCVLGHGILYRYGEKGEGSNLNQAFYIQDKWQPHRQLTLNLGVRYDRYNGWRSLAFDPRKPLTLSQVAEPGTRSRFVRVSLYPSISS